jgi:hypothetical protein
MGTTARESVEPYIARDALEPLFRGSGFGINFHVFDTEESIILFRKLNISNILFSCLCFC